ncbi:hypothetical protein FRC02_006298 [Tulasnella sp. 418]|nr:hypothetical protein FRC02_006298 [Tulasnella sp. 418]
MSLIACIAAAGVLNTETTQAFSTEVFRVGRDPVYWVRREAAYALGALAKVAPFDLVFSTLVCLAWSRRLVTEALKRLVVQLNLYDILTKDRVWHVRQSALFALPGILSRLPAGQRKHLALSQTALLTRDPSRSVRSGVLEIMGEVIYSFRDDEGGPPTELVDLFIGRGENNGKPETENPPESNWNEAAGGPTWDLPETPFATRKPVERPARPPSFHSIFEDNSDSGSSSDSARELFGSRSSFLTGANQYSRDPERSLICAFNFPAVVLATGKDRWVELKVYYHVLTQSHVVKVRRTLGASLGEIARIIGPENTHQDLLPVWWDALHDSDAEVRMKVIKSLDTFVAALSLEDRVKVGKQLDTLWTQTLYGWKEREALAGLLGSLANSLAQADDFDSARLLAMRAIIDTVAAVREAAITAFPKLLKELSPNNQALDLAYADLYSLASTDIFRRRTAFTSACTALLVADHAHRLVNSDEFWSCLRSLSDDAVIDVRIGLARLVATLCERLYPDVYARPQAIADLIRKLYRDPSIDVKSYVSHLIHTPSSPLTAVSSSSSGQLFATFSRPPTAPSLLTDEMDDYEGDDDPAMDMDLENVDSTAQRQLPVEGSEPTNV